MTLSHLIRTVLLPALACLSCTLAAAQTAPRDGSHDFDFEVGAWKSQITRLSQPLTGSTTWVKFEGAVKVRPLWGGRAFLEEIEADGANGVHVSGLTLRLYNPQSHQWSFYWANGADGTLGQPTTGEFKNGRGEFYDQETLGGRSILVRQVFSEISPDVHHFEQAYSSDGGKTWEPNWIATLTREGH